MRKNMYGRGAPRPSSHLHATKEREIRSAPFGGLHACTVKDLVVDDERLALRGLVVVCGTDPAGARRSSERMSAITGSMRLAMLMRGIRTPPRL